MKTIELSKDTTLFDKQIEKNDAIYWSLIFRRTGAESIELTLDTDIIKDNSMLTKMNIALFNKKNMRLKVPFLVDAFEKDERLYVFLYKHWSVMLQIYVPDNRVNYKKTEYLLSPMFGGSFENFGDRYVTILDKQKFGNLFFCDIAFGRTVIGQSKKLIYIDTESDTLYEIIFPEKSDHHIKDRNQTFRTLNFALPQSHITIDKAIKSTLTTKGKLSVTSDFKYLWAFDSNNLSGGTRTSGITYFFYQEANDSKVKIIRYDNYNKTWLLDDYKKKACE